MTIVDHRDRSESGRFTSAMPPKAALELVGSRGAADPKWTFGVMLILDVDPIWVLPMMR